MAKNLKALAMAKMSGFRHLSVVVPEWEGATVILREPQQKHGCVGRILSEKMMKPNYLFLRMPGAIWTLM
jgi:hypothetical protein